jgi:hypothetical protein
MDCSFAPPLPCARQHRLSTVRFAGPATEYSRESDNNEGPGFAIQVWLPSLESMMRRGGREPTRDCRPPPVHVWVNVAPRGAEVTMPRGSGNLARSRLSRRLLGHERACVAGRRPAECWLQPGLAARQSCAHFHHSLSPPLGVMSNLCHRHFGLRRRVLLVRWGGREP